MKIEIENIQMTDIEKIFLINKVEEFIQQELRTRKSIYKIKSKNLNKAVIQEATDPLEALCCATHTFPYEWQCIQYRKYLHIPTNTIWQSYKGDQNHAKTTTALQQEAHTPISTNSWQQSSEE
jgi:hypothetical protein